MANVEDENHSRCGRGGDAQATLNARTTDRATAAGSKPGRAKTTSRSIPPSTPSCWMSTITASGTSRKARSSRARFSRSPPSEVIVDVGYKSEGIIADRRVPRRERRSHRAGRRHRRRAARAHRRSRRLRRPLARKSREDEDLGRGREGLCRAQGRHRPRHRADQGRPGGRHRRARVPARIADRRASGAQPRRAARPGAAHARHQGQQEARQHRALAQGAARGRERREEEAHARDARRRQGAQGRRQEHHRLRRVHRSRRHRRPAAHHRHVVGPRRPSVGAVQGQRRDRRDRAQVRPGDRARVARPQAAHHRSVGERDGSLSGRRAHGRQGRQPDRLRRVRRARSRASKG